MALKLSNNASGILAAAISNSATSLTLRSGQGSRFPVLGPGDWFPITVVRASDPSQREIMRCIGRNGDTLTVERAQEGTSAIAFSAGDVVELRLTAGTLEENFPQVEGRNAKNLRFIIGSVGGKPELKFKSGNNEETVVRQSDIGDVVRTSRTISTGTGLTGGGDLSANRTISIASSHWPIGVGQTWQDVKSQRDIGVNYTNTTGRTIFVVVPFGSDTTAGLDLIVDGEMIDTLFVRGAPGVWAYSKVSGPVPPGSIYRIKLSTGSGVYWWMELR